MNYIAGQYNRGIPPPPKRPPRPASQRMKSDYSYTRGYGVSRVPPVQNIEQIRPIKPYSFTPKRRSALLKAGLKRKVFGRRIRSK